MAKLFALVTYLNATDIDGGGDDDPPPPLGEGAETAGLGYQPIIVAVFQLT